MSSLVWKRSTFLPPWFLPQALELFLIEARWPGLLRSQRPQHWFGGRRAREPLLLGSSQRQPSNNEPIDAHVKLPSATIPILPRSPCPWGHLGQRAEGCGSTLDSAFRQKQTWSACGWVSTTQARLPPPHLTRARTHSLAPHDPAPPFPFRHSLISPPSSLSLKISWALSTFQSPDCEDHGYSPHLTSAAQSTAARPCALTGTYKHARALAYADSTFPVPV